MKPLKSLLILTLIIFIQSPVTVFAENIPFDKDKGLSEFSEYIQKLTNGETSFSLKVRGKEASKKYGYSNDFSPFYNELLRRVKREIELEESVHIKTTLALGRDIIENFNHIDFDKLKDEELNDTTEFINELEKKRKENVTFYIDKSTSIYNYRNPEKYYGKAASNVNIEFPAGPINIKGNKVEIIFLNPVRKNGEFLKTQRVKTYVIYSEIKWY